MFGGPSVLTQRYPSIYRKRFWVVGCVVGAGGSGAVVGPVEGPVVDSAVVGWVVRRVVGCVTGRVDGFFVSWLASSCTRICSARPSISSLLGGSPSGSRWNNS